MAPGPARSAESRVAPFTLTIFGATGDLTRRKLMPALYALFSAGRLPDAFAVVGFARRDYDDASFRDWIGAAIREFAPDPPEAESLARFLRSVHYHRADFESDPEALEAFRARCAREAGWPANRFFYLAVKPDMFGPLVEGLAAAGLVRPPSAEAWSRVVIEKPFGHDLASARALNRRCLDRLDESQIYRIDHYLGKETVQNILSFRFANAIFEPLFNSRLVHHVQITAAETVGMENARGAYYDAAGAVRDMLQNHLLQLLCLAAMEPPAQMTADAIRNEKVKVLQSIVPPSPGCIETAAVRGQYAAGRVGDADVPGFREEARVRPDSKTPTYVALRLAVENWRWAGVPFYLRTGKRMAARATEIVFQFRTPPLQLFETVACVGDVCDLTRAKPNRLIFRIQPREGISLRFSAKRPGAAIQVEDVDMNFGYAETWRRALPEAYERLLLDVLRGDSTLFTRSDEVEAAWRIVQPLLDAWERHDIGALYPYPAGSWGPTQADCVFEHYDADWHVPAAR